MLSGILCGLLCAELAVRIYSAVNTTTRARLNIERSRQKNGITIVCLGDSITQNAYPGELEKLLQKALPQTKITVLDEGYAGKTSNQLADKAPRIIKEYKPDIIIAMMGDMDADNNFIRYGNIQNPIDYWLTSHSKLYAWVRFSLIEQNARKTIRTIAPPKPVNTSFELQKHPQHEQLAQKRGQLEARIRQNHQTINIHFDKHLNLLEEGNFDAFFKTGKLIQLCDTPDENTTAHHTAQLLMQKFIKESPERKEKLLEYCKNQLTSQPGPQANGFAFLLIQLYYRTQNEDKIPLAARFAQQTYPYSQWLAMCMLRHANADKTKFMQNWLADMQMRINSPLQHPFCIFDYYEPVLLEQLDMPEQQIIPLLEKFIPAFWQTGSASQMLALLYTKHNMPERALGLYNFWYQNMYSATHTPEAEKDFWNKTLALNNKSNRTNFAGFNSPVLKTSLRKLASLCRDNGIVLVCMQYPMLDISPLQNMLFGFDVVFVNNAEPFRSLVGKNGFATYFVDNLGGCFGHTTHEGNRLIAQNAAKAIENIYNENN